MKLEDAYYYKHMAWWQSYYRQLFRTWLNPEFLTIESQNLVTRPGSLGFEDLHIKPISFGAKAHELVNDVYWLYNAHTGTKREGANQ